MERSPDSPLAFGAAGPVDLTPGSTGSALADALQSLHSTIAFSSMDWGAARDTTWIYGILVGWCEPEDLCMNCDPEEDYAEGPCVLDSIAQERGWDETTITRLRRFRAAVRAAGEGGAL
jgi:hypothetical protein